MDEYYKILGLGEDAGPEEIKRAYFRLVRKYSPERDPERFQEIRRAYEYLKDKNSEKKKNVVRLEIPEDPMGQRMMHQVSDSYQKRNYDLTVRTAEEAIRVFGQCSGYLYYLAKAQRMLGQTGKSAKNLELLVKRHPDEIEFCRELAISLQERGYGRKAYDAFEKAYEMGCREPEFLRLFGMCCQERKKPRRGIQILERMVKEEREKAPMDVMGILEAYTGLFSMSMEVSEQDFLRFAEDFRGFLTESGIMLEPYAEDIGYILKVVGIVGVSGERGVISISAGRKVGRMLLESAGKLFPREKKQWDRIEKTINVVAIQNDSEIPKSIRRAVDAFYDPEEEYMENAQFLRFIQTDCRLCLLEEWPGNREKLELVKERYPQVYAAMEDAVRQMERTDTALLREILLKDYDRMSQYYEGYYYQEYPERKPGRERQAWDSEEDGTFRRAGKKVGRNDPCPCGSGKKYKNCCGRR